MIGQLSLIRNVGRFDSYAAGMGTDLSRLTLFYADNARGKTTLCAILRSLQSGEALPVAERKRLGGSGAPHVVVQLQPQPDAVFQNGGWSTTLPDMFVYDDVFVDENVYSGLDVGSQQRASLHELIIGKQGVVLAKEVEALTAQIATAQSEVRESERKLDVSIRGSYSVDDFCALTQNTNAPDELRLAKRTLAALEQSSKVRSTAAFGAFAFPVIDFKRISQTLSVTFEQLDSEAVEQVHRRASALGSRGEAWIAAGLKYSEEMVDEECPFCQQDLRNSPIIDHYRAYFGEAYKQHKAQIGTLLKEVAASLGGDSLARFQRAVEEERVRRDFWSQFIDVPPFESDAQTVAMAWQQARDAIINLLDEKQKSPLESIETDSRVRGRISNYLDASNRTLALSDSLIAMNSTIAVTKTNIEEGDHGASRNDVRRLESQIRRYEPDVELLCNDYFLARHRKAKLELDKTAARSALDDHRKKVFPRYEGRINHYLSRFTADFRIAQVAPTNPRGLPSASYYLVINNEPVQITGDPQPGQPTFKNTLSGGDRNTLALAFFLAALDDAPNLSSSVIVIDDPSSSLDDGRTVATAQQIRNFAERAKQTIVLSHRKHLLCSIAELVHNVETSALEIKRDAGGSTIVPWDLNDALTTEHDKRHSDLRDYVNGVAGVDSREVAQSLRPVIEGYLRVVRTEFFPPGTLLGTFLGTCTTASAIGDEILSASEIHELKEINEYARQFHHTSNQSPTQALGNINDSELLAWAKRVLRFVSHK